MSGIPEFPDYWIAKKHPEYLFHLSLHRCVEYLFVASSVIAQRKHSCLWTQLAWVQFLAFSKFLSQVKHLSGEIFSGKFDFDVAEVN